MWFRRDRSLPGTPDWSTPLVEARLLAVDVETTGLDANTDQLLSIGWVPVTCNRIELGGAGHVVLRGRPGFSVGRSATIHHLTDDDLAAGLDEAEALGQFVAAMEGRMMLAHFAPMEQNFLGALHKRVRGTTVGLPAVDTFSIERRHMERMATYPRGEDLRLARVRERYGLPVYRNHNALSDALACAELYLAQQGAIRAQTLRDLRY